jgi:hypothetical protein
MRQPGTPVDHDPAAHRAALFARSDSARRSRCTAAAGREREHAVSMSDRACHATEHSRPTPRRLDKHFPLWVGFDAVFRCPAREPARHRRASAHADRRTDRGPGAAPGATARLPPVNGSDRYVTDVARHGLGQGRACASAKKQRSAPRDRSPLHRITQTPASQRIHRWAEERVPTSTTVARPPAGSGVGRRGRQAIGAPSPEAARNRPALLQEAP